MKYTFYRIGGMNSIKQKHKEGNVAPASRGIWLLPRKFTRSDDLFWMGKGSAGSTKYNTIENLYKEGFPLSKVYKESKRLGLIKTIELDDSTEIFSKIKSGNWEKISVKDYIKNLYKVVKKLRNLYPGSNATPSEDITEIFLVN